jgi:medium-chain acyl-[acyl-carrier-protein] hydrolase
MRTVPNIWIEKRTIESFDVDMVGRLRPQTLFGFLLNAAWNHARGTSYGYVELSTRNLMWVLIKTQLVVRRQAKWGEQLTIETWGKRIERLYALRDFTVSLLSGEKVASATSLWIVLDKSSGRPQRFNQATDGFPWQPSREELNTDLVKVQELSTGMENARFRVLFSDIDVNGHVGSTRYLQWMIDSHRQEYLEKRELGSIEISFLSEALQKDEVSVFSEEVEGIELCSVRRVADGKDLCRARFRWSPSS